MVKPELESSAASAGSQHPEPALVEVIRMFEAYLIIADFLVALVVPLAVNTGPGTVFLQMTRDSCLIPLVVRQESSCQSPNVKRMALYPKDEWATTLAEIPPPCHDQGTVVPLLQRAVDKTMSRLLGSEQGTQQSLPVRISRCTNTDCRCTHLAVTISDAIIATVMDMAEAKTVAARKK